MKHLVTRPARRHIRRMDATPPPDPFAVTSLAALEALHDPPSAPVMNKVAHRPDAATQAFIAATYPEPMRSTMH